MTIGTVWPPQLQPQPLHATSQQRKSRNREMCLEKFHRFEIWQGPPQLFNTQSRGFETSRDIFSGKHYSDVIMGAIVSQISSLASVLLNRLIRCRSKKTSKLRVTGLCAGNSPETGEIPAQRASNAENVSIWWSHHGVLLLREEILAD